MATPKMTIFTETVGGAFCLTLAEDYRLARPTTEGKWRLFHDGGTATVSSVEEAVLFLAEGTLPPKPTTRS